MCREATFPFSQQHTAKLPSDRMSRERCCASILPGHVHALRPSECTSNWPSMLNSNNSNEIKNINAVIVAIVMTVVLIVVVILVITRCEDGFNQWQNAGLEQRTLPTWTTPSQVQLFELPPNRKQRKFTIFCQLLTRQAIWSIHTHPSVAMTGDRTRVRYTSSRAFDTKVPGCICPSWLP